jgi:hypothetical protein
MPEEVINPYDAVRYPTTGVRSSEMMNRISWGAVWAGVMIALGLELLLTLFGLFIGFGMYNYQAASPWAGISPWTTAWYLFTAAVSMFFGAWCAARLSGSPVREAGVLHGLTTWGLATVATIAFATVGTWSVLREGVNVLSTAAITTATMAQSPGTAPAAANAARQANREAAAIAQNSGPGTQATAHAISRLALGLCGGVLLGFITAIFGGLLGRARSVFFEERQVPLGPTRLAA